MLHYTALHCIILYYIAVKDAIIKVITTCIVGKVFLMMKTIERAHQPANMWEKIRLSHNYETALKQVRIYLHNSVHTLREKDCACYNTVYIIFNR